MSIDAIIEALGGATQVQALLGVGPSAVSNYRARGQFPEYARVRVWQALKARGIMVDPETLAFDGQDTPPSGKVPDAGPDTGPDASMSVISDPSALSKLTRMPTILLIISGGIAAYKALEIIRRMRDRQWNVRVVMTASAQQFITPLSVSALSGNTTYHELFSLTDEAEMGHIRLAREADVVVVAPATANLMAKMAHGLADDLATTVLLATGAPVLIAPAMNPFMWANPATQTNKTILQQRGIRFVGPASGDTACGEDGAGRLSDPHDIITATEQLLPGKGRLNGMKALVTSGPTHEPIDAVRYIANHSSGKQGHAIAAALAREGAMVTLISGPVDEPPPRRVAVVSVRTAREMETAALAALPSDIAICAAAVGDFSVANESTQKIKKPDDGSAPTLTLRQNPDILATICHHQMRPKLVIGFAAETQHTVDYAMAKRLRKGADWMLANDVGQADAPVFGSDNNLVHLITEMGNEAWPEASKQEIADHLIDRIAKEFNR